MSKVLFACTTPTGTDFPRIKDEIFPKIYKHVGNDNIKFITIQSGKDWVPQHPISDHYNTNICQYIETHDDIFEVVVFGGCNSISWLFPKISDIQNLYNHITPTGMIILAETGNGFVKRYGTKYISFEQQTARPSGIMLYPERSPLLIDVFNCYFNYMGNGEYQKQEEPFPKLKDVYEKYKDNPRGMSLELINQLHTITERKVSMGSRRSTNKTILFYRNKTPINDATNFYYKDILIFSDYELDSLYTSTLFTMFPDDLSKEDVEYFKTNDKIRVRVVKLVEKFVNSCSYRFANPPKYIKKIGKIKKEENYRFVGMYSLNSMLAFSLMMEFLNKINMPILSSMIMLMLCNAIHKDEKFKFKVKKLGYLSKWFKTQPYLQKYADKYNIDVMSDKTATCDVTGMKYTGNSCYQDSTLIALFAIPNEFITKHILEKDLTFVSMNPRRELVCSANDEKDLKYRKAIQREIVSITNSMRGSEKNIYCSTLRNLIKKCPVNQKFYSTETQDAGEFLQFLFSVFDVQDTTIQRITYFTNMTNTNMSELSDAIISEVKIPSSPVILIPSYNIRARNDTEISYFLTREEDALFDQKNLIRKDGKTFKRRLEMNRIVDADYLVFYAQRLYGDRGKRTYNTIIPQEVIRVFGDKHLQLQAIVVHEHVHYTCYFRCNTTWFFFNDIKEKLASVGTYQQLLTSNAGPNVQTHGVLYFYTT